MEPVQPTRNGPLLVVDDDPDARDGLRDVLEDAGFTVICVGNGKQALTYLRENPAPACILLDLFMPVMNGWQFARQLQTMAGLASVPVLVVTAQEPHWGYPTSHVLRKPIDASDLVRTVRAMLGDSGGLAA